jgi:hypothetical protein
LKRSNKGEIGEGGGKTVAVFRPVLLLAGGGQVAQATGGVLGVEEAVELVDVSQNLLAGRTIDLQH